MTKKTELISRNTERIAELSDIVNILIGRIAKLEHELEQLRINNKS